jgi:hypothetical protein
VLTVLSVVPTMGLTLTWGSTDGVPGTIWGALVRLPVGATSLRHSLAASAVDWLGTTRTEGAALAALCAVAAVTISIVGAARATEP